MQDCWHSDQRCLACIFLTISLRVSGDSQECFHSAQRCFSLLWEELILEIKEQGGLQECWHSAQPCLPRSCISMTIRSEILEQGGLQECCRSVQRCQSLVLMAIRSEIKEQGGLCNGRTLFTACSMGGLRLQTRIAKGMCHSCKMCPVCNKQGFNNKPREKNQQEAYVPAQRKALGSL